MHAFCRSSLWVALGLTIPCGAAPIVRPTVSLIDVGHPHNPPDVNQLGAVQRGYSISRLEVTNAEYAQFLNACAAVGDAYSLYDLRMTVHPAGGIIREGSGTGADPFRYSSKPSAADRPVNFVSYYDAVRFANWMSRSGGSDTTEEGSYRIRNGGPDSGQIGSRQGLIGYAIPTEHEWYKAAHYDPNRGIRGGYRLVTSPSFYGMLDPPTGADEWLETQDTGPATVVRGAAFEPEMIGISRRSVTLSTSSSRIGIRLVFRPRTYGQTMGEGGIFSETRTSGDLLAVGGIEAHPRYPWEDRGGGGGGGGGGGSSSGSSVGNTLTFPSSVPDLMVHPRQSTPSETPSSNPSEKPVPEPSSAILLALGLGLLKRPRRRAG